MSHKTYWYRLKNLGLPAIESIEDLAAEARLSLKKIKYLSYRSEYLYKVYDIPKKTGKKRIIAQPSRELKALQAWMLRNILDKLSSSEHSKGFDKGSSILDNASPHIGANYILTVDLEDFFPNVKAAHVYNIFNSIGYNKKISSALTNICTFKGGLPQGAPTSPKLANLVCAKLDSRLHGYTGQRGIVYTRYADDLTLSGQTPQKIYKAKQFIGTVVSDEGFTINKSKTKIAGTQRQKKVTGLIVSEENVGIGRQKYREIRAIIHHYFEEKRSDFSYINGVIAFTYSVDRKVYKRIQNYINKLKEKYPESDIHKSFTTDLTEKNA